MEPSIENVVDYLEHQSYTLKILALCSIGEFHYEITPPNFPQEGVETEEQQLEYTNLEKEKILDILFETFPTKYGGTKPLRFIFSIKKPAVKSEQVAPPLTNEHS